MRITLRSLPPQSDLIEHLSNQPVTRAALQALSIEALANDVADLHARIERPARILKDELQLAPKASQFRAVQFGNLRAIERQLSSARLHQAHKNSSERGLSASGFPDQAECLAAADIQIDAVNRPGICSVPPPQPATDREVFLDTTGVQQRLMHLRLLPAV